MNDLIRRKDAIDAMYRLEAEDIETYGCFIPEGFHANQAVEALKALPSAEPERTAKVDRDAIFPVKVCGICHSVVDYPEKYCSECGAKLDWNE